MTDHLERQLARLRDQLAILAGTRPTPEQLAGEEAADKDMARRIHQARPGIPPHHVLATLEAFRSVLEMEPAEPMPVSPQLAEQLREAIESEVYEYRERTMFWEETGGVTEEIARLAARGAMKALSEHGDSRGYCPACGRGDCAPTADEYEQQRQRAQQLAATLDDVLRHFVHKGHPGEPCLSSGWISEKTVARWREALYTPTRTETTCPCCPHPGHGDFCGVTEGINKCACTGDVIPV